MTTSIDPTIATTNQSNDETADVPTVTIAAATSGAVSFMDDTPTPNDDGDGANMAKNTATNNTAASAPKTGMGDACKHAVHQEVSGHAGLFLPWNRAYRIWWAITLIASILTVFLEPYLIAFVPVGMTNYTDAASILQYISYSIFFIDLFVNFNLAYYNEADDIIVMNRRSIALNYLKFMFWIDLIGVFPFVAVALACTGQIGQDSELAAYLSLLGLLKLVRLHRVRLLFQLLQYSSKISLISLTLTRNFGFALVWTHLNACIMYFISARHGFDEDMTFIGGSIADLDALGRYVTSLYWSVVTFTTVGYGDYSPQNSAEQIWGIIYMFVNILFQAWIIGSMTLLIVKNDQKTGEFRDTMQILDKYSKMNGFERSLQKRLKAQIKLDFNNSEICDEAVLQKFPSSLRRRVLRRLYLPSLMRTSLLKGIRQQFVDAFLATCRVEIFSPGEEILQRGSVSSDLYLLVAGTVELTVKEAHRGGSGGGGKVGRGGSSETANLFGSIADSDMTIGHGGAGGSKLLSDGEFINEVGFFTESAQSDNVRTLTVCKTLTMSRSAYKTIAEDHPGSAGKILQNLLAKVEEMAAQLDPASAPQNMGLSKRLALMRAGSVFDVRSKSRGSDNNTNHSNNLHDDPSSSHAYEIHNTVTSVQTHAALTAIQELIKMHISKQKDDHTTRFLFAASRGDTNTIDLMCEHGFDPNSADYDQRTALMVAAMKGNTEVVTRILEHQANPNICDMHGSTALHEAARNGHDDTMAVLLAHGGTLCMEEGLAASTLCQAVSDGDILRLKRLVRAGIDANAADYDRRTAAHIAAAEGNVVALKVLVENGANVLALDRWGNTIYDEAKRSNAGQLLAYLKTFQEQQQQQQQQQAEDTDDIVMDF